MPTTPVRNQGEPITRQDASDLVRFLSSGRAPNPPDDTRGEEIDQILETDLPVSGHGDDLYLYEEDDAIYSDRRQPNPSSQDSHKGQPPDAKWVLKGSPFPKMSVTFKRKFGDPFTATWAGAAFLKNGNSKVACYTWDLPEGATCPGRSAFCLDCYAVAMSKGTKESSMMGSRVLRLKAWAEHREWWRKEMVAECLKYGAMAPVRIHVAGDFFNAEYTRDWIGVVKACPGTYFWGYTRSWAVDPKAKGAKDLLKALNELRALPNMTLFASFDPTMPVPPANWLWAGIYGDPRMSTKRRVPRPVIICPEIAGTPQDWRGVREGAGPPLAADGFPRLATCRACGWCWNTANVPLPTKVQADGRARGSLPMKGKRGDVAFPRHGAKVEIPEPGSIPWQGPMPTTAEVEAYSIARNGGGRGNRVIYSTAMAQLKRSVQKTAMATEVLKRDKEDHAAKFYMKEFEELVGDAKVAFREMEV